MLDAYIINRIRQQGQESLERGASRIPLRIEVPPPPPDDEPRPDRDDADRDRGVAIIDFNI